MRGVRRILSVFGNFSKVAFFVGFAGSHNEIRIYFHVMTGRIFGGWSYWGLVGGCLIWGLCIAELGDQTLKVSGLDSACMSCDEGRRKIYVRTA